MTFAQRLKLAALKYTTFLSLILSSMIAYLLANPDQVLSWLGQLPISPAWLAAGAFVIHLLCSQAAQPWLAKFKPQQPETVVPPSWMQEPDKFSGLPKTPEK